eukprot:TRINITY_DN3474_c0_g1_i2.p1 TRINITY_DN3474_c0_g1~~TRINITY_DN3474_c0_g1_i2.p1  ORF type:complete len:127 (+),score=33.62 TRINITY_DN3474_c0_g1_i2:55-381(+)
MLGRDIWLHIFRFLTWWDLLKCDFVCKYFWMLSHSEGLWEKILYSKYPDVEFQHQTQKQNSNQVLSGFRNLFISKQEKYQLFLWDMNDPWRQEYKNSELFWRAQKNLW